MIVIMEKKYLKPEIELVDVDLEQLMNVSDGKVSMDDEGADGSEAISRALDGSIISFE